MDEFFQLRGCPNPEDDWEEQKRLYMAATTGTALTTFRTAFTTYEAVERGRRNKRGMHVVLGQALNKMAINIFPGRYEAWKQQRRYLANSVYISPGMSVHEWVDRLLTLNRWLDYFPTKTDTMKTFTGRHETIALSNTKLMMAMGNAAPARWK